MWFKCFQMIIQLWATGDVASVGSARHWPLCVASGTLSKSFAHSCSQTSTDASSLDRVTPLNICIMIRVRVNPHTHNIHNYFSYQPLSIFLALMRELCLSFSVSLCVCMCLSVPLCLSLCLSLYVSLCPTLSVSLSLSLVSVCMCLSVPLCLSLFLCLSLSVCVSLSHSVCLSFSVRS